VDPLLVVRNLSRFRDLQITGYRVQLQGPNPPQAPGVDRLPGPGEIVVSPALAALLDGPEGELLRPRFPERITGTIGPEGLVGPNELAFYAGASDVAGTPEAVTVSEFGPASKPPLRPPPRLLPLLVILGVVSLLIPVVIFLASATRLASQARDRRLAAIRLVGGSRDQVRRIAVGEVLVGAVAGLGAGVLLFFAGRSSTTLLNDPVFGNGFYTGDIRPAPLPAALVLLAVPVLGVGLTLFSLRRTLVDPLSVVRRAPRTTRLLWWRVAPLLAGGYVLATETQHADTSSAPANGSDLFGSVGKGTVLGIVLVLLGVAILLPWLIERTVRMLGGGGTPAWQLATRRLQHDVASSARIVGGVAAAVAGGIALQSVFIPAEDLFVKENPEYTHQIAVDAKVTDPGEAAQLAATLRRIDGVRRLSPVVSYQAVRDSRHREGYVYVAPCPTLRRLAKLPRCVDGEMYKVVPPKGKVGLGARLRSGEPVFSVEGSSTPAWTWPVGVPTVVSRRTNVFASAYLDGILATPGAMADARIQAYSVSFDVVAAPGHPDAVEHIRNAAAPTHWSTKVSQPTEYRTDRRYALIRSALFLGALVVMVLAALSLLVVALEQLRERRRPLAMLTAGGVRRSVLAWSLLWQAAIPTVLGLAAALGVGAVMARLLLQAAGREVTYDWPAIAALSTGALVAVLLATALTLPALWRSTTAAGIRAE
jgi:hypothetical protein